MATSTQSWSIADGTMFLTQRSDVKIDNWYVLNTTQQARVAEAMGLWDDVSGFTPIRAVDDDNLARNSTTIVTEYVFGIPTDWYWKNSLPNEWTRVALADIAGDTEAGVNIARTLDDVQARYHEVYIERTNDGSGTFEARQRGISHPRSRAGSLGAGFSALADGGGEHIRGHMTATVMDPTQPATHDAAQPWRTWIASTPDVARHRRRHQPIRCGHHDAHRRRYLRLQRPLQQWSPPLRLGLRHQHAAAGHHLRQRRHRYAGCLRIP